MSVEERRLYTELSSRKSNIMRMKSEYSNVDVAFLLDCTSSMDKHIVETKNQLKVIIDTLVEEFENEIRVAFVGYRDHADGAKRLEVVDFTSDASRVKRYLGSVTATGGGDACEDVFGGLNAAAKLTWKARNRVIIHAADAPAHGSRFHDGISDDYSTYNDMDVNGLRIEEILSQLKRQNIFYFFGKITSFTDKMIREFKRVGGNTSVNEIDLTDPRKLYKQCVTAVAGTINSSLDMLAKKVTRVPTKLETASSPALTTGIRSTRLLETKSSMVFKPNPIRCAVGDLRTSLTFEDFTSSYSVMQAKIKIAGAPFEHVS